MAANCRPAHLPSFHSDWPMQSTRLADRTPFLYPALSLAALLAVWAVTSLVARSDALPTPWAVAERAATEARSGALLWHLGITLARVAVAFLIAMLVGTAIGIGLGGNRRADQLFGPWLTIALNMPALVTIILCYVWFGLNETAAVLAVTLNKIPTVAVSLREGTKTLDPNLEDVAGVYRFGFWTRLRHVVLPQLAPYIWGAVRTGLALTWKIVLVVEFIGRSNGVGFRMNLFFQQWDITGVLVYALAFIFVAQAFEGLVIAPWQAWSERWQLEPAR